MILGSSASARNNVRVSLDFASQTSEQDEVAVIVTSPLTTNEEWTAFGQGELLVFSEGRRVRA